MKKCRNSQKPLTGSEGDPEKEPLQRKGEIRLHFSGTPQTEKT